MQKLFGTDGIRGLVDGDLINPLMAYKLGRALTCYCQDKNVCPKIIIARDTRASGKILETALARGVESAGGSFVLGGVIPTPGLAFLTKAERCDFGVVISASHNDYRYNGFKVFSAQGEKLTQEEEEKIEKLILNDNSSPDLNNFNFSKKNLPNALDKYQDFLLLALNNDFNFADFKIIFDCANGASSELAEKIFSKISANIKIINNKPDGNNINENCGSEHPENLSQKVIAEGADLGIAFDGDADRIQIVDELGQTVSGDQVLYICAKFLQANNLLKNNILVCTIMSNQGFVNDLQKIGINSIRTDVGDRNVAMEMKKQSAQIGGEESGHIIFSDYHSTGDGILTALIFLQAIKYFGKKVSDLAAEVKLLPKILLNTEVKQKPDLESLPELQKKIKEVENYLGDKGRILVRYSGTEPKCRVMVEGEDREEIDKFAKEIIEVIKREC